jgi:tartrate-resistant acid phosphatase type 5
MPVVFCALGDMGSGNKDQYKIGRIMANNIKKNNAQFVLGLGDNIYESGVTSIDDKLFISKFEKPYENISDKIKFYMIIGNHDYGEYWDRFFKPRFQYQIGYGILSQKLNKKWYMPNYYYMFSKKQNGCHIDFFCIDTNIDIMSKTMKDKQSKEIIKLIKSSNANWKILVGHHTYRSIAGHGNAEPDLERYLNIFLKLGIDVYMNGHDHNNQVVERILNGRNITILQSGSGGKKYDDHGIELDNILLKKDSELIYHDEKLGFMNLFAYPTKINVEFIGDNGRKKYSHTIFKNKK